VSSAVTRKPVTRVVAVGTRVPEPSGGGDCAPGYSPCVPVASDVDCAGGSGNGPAYVSGPIRVTGSDPYDLDRDGDGIACEAGGDDDAPTETEEPATGTDPRFDTCAKANAAGYGPYVRGTDPEYEWYVDRDSDGVACER
jgi:hypothetical protein